MQAPVFVLGAALAALAPLAVGGEARNVLVLVADDLGVDVLASYGEGEDLPPTPALDALAARGVRFRNFYTSPVCSPTRASLLTGRYPFRTGVGNVVVVGGTIGALSLDEVTLPEMLDLGTGGIYRRAAFGKWHVSTIAPYGYVTPNLHGFEHFVGVPFVAGDYFDWTKVTDGVAGPSTEYQTSAFVDEAVAWFATAGEPWFAYVAFTAPHKPFHAPPPELTTIDLSPWGSPAENLREHYKAMVEALDTEIGRLLDGLDPEVRARTTVLFLGDNGTPKGVTAAPFVPSHAKGTLYEGGVNTPLIVAGPPVDAAGTAGTESAALAHVVDLFPTIAEIVGVDLASAFPGLVIDGASLAPSLADPAAPGARPFVFVETYSPSYPDAQVPTDWCQQDLGSGGPGDLALSICGMPLAFGGGATLRVENAKPLGTVFLLASAWAGATPFLGGTLVPVPQLAALPYVADGAGAVSLAVPGMPGGLLPPYTIYFQAYGKAGPPTGGWELSNAVSAGFELPLAIGRAVRDGRWKLIRVSNATLEFTTTEELYDLDADPFELDDLLPLGLDAEQQAAYDALAALLDGVVAS